MKLNTSIRKRFRVSNKVKKVASKDRFRLSISRSSKNISAQIIDDTTKRLWGMNRSLINNAVIGSSKGYEKTLELVGVGYRAALKGNQLNLQLGYSHDINFNIPEGIKIAVEKQTTLKITGSDKQLVGEVASKIKTLRKIEPYKGKGVREKGQYVLKKAVSYTHLRAHET